MRALPLITAIGLASVVVLATACNSGSFAGGSAEPAPKAQAKPKPPASPTQPAAPRDEDAGGTGKKDPQNDRDDSGDDDKGAAADDPSAPSHGKKSVAKGAFVIWADPETPIPGVPYNVFIQVRLPEGTTTFEKTDLSGALTGTDGYSQLIGKSLLDDPSSGDYQSEEIHGRYGLLTLLVPGGVPDGKDTVKVRSVLARDEQTLVIKY